MKLKPGETAFIVSVSERLTVQYTKLNERPVQFELTSARDRAHHACFTTGNRAVAPTTANPFALTGPATITTKTSGVVSMKVVTEAAKTK